MATHLGNVDHSLPFYQFHHSDDTSLSLSASPNNIPITTTTSWSSFASSESVLSSPVASEVGSTETESHPDDDFMDELTRQMTHFMFQDDDKLEKSWLSDCSPQSTHWSSLGMNHERQIDPSREPAPPGPGPNGIEEFEKMKMNCGVPLTMSMRNDEFHSKQALIDEQIRAIQFFKLRQEQLMKQLEYQKQLKACQNKARAYSGSNNIGQRTVRPPTSPSVSPPTSPSVSPWSNMQQSNQQPSSGMRAVFLGEPGSKSGSGGTGVFLPKGIGNPSESRKKPGCSTVLIPARVVQALKQHFDKVGVPNASRFNIWSPPAMNHQDMGLPPERTCRQPSQQEVFEFKTGLKEE